MPRRCQGDAKAVSALCALSPLPKSRPVQPRSPPPPALARCWTRFRGIEATPASLLAIALRCGSDANLCILAFWQLKCESAIMLLLMFGCPSGCRYRLQNTPPTSKSNSRALRNPAVRQACARCVARASGRRQWPSVFAGGPVPDSSRTPSRWNP
jgi:hypothetical protein